MFPWSHLSKNKLWRSKKIFLIFDGEKYKYKSALYNSVRLLVFSSKSLKLVSAITNNKFLS